MQGILCPLCLAELDPVDAQTAACVVHGEFQVLYSRQTAPKVERIPAIASAQPAATTASVDTGRDLEAARALAVLGLAEKPKSIVTPAGTILAGKCTNHPKIEAIQNCLQCNASMCRMCLYRSPYGKKLCPACLASKPVNHDASSPSSDVAPAGAAVIGAPADANGILELAPAVAAAHTNLAPNAPPPKPNVNPVMIGIRCGIHADEQAVFKCKICQNGVCETCDFKIGSMHVCPECVMKPRAEISRRRFRYVVWGYVCAAMCVAMVVLHTNLLVFGIVTLIGVACSFSALEKRLPNSISLWIGVVLNGLLYALLVIEVACRIFARA